MAGRGVLGEEKLERSECPGRFGGDSSLSMSISDAGGLVQLVFVRTI